MNFIKAMEAELSFAREKYGLTKSAHEGYAVIFEELDEFWDEVKKQDNKRNFINMYKELVQVAAMAKKVAEDIVIPLIKKER